MVLPFWTFFASSNESVSCLAVCWVVHSSKREEILFINHQIEFLEISTVKVKRWWDKGVSEGNLVIPYEVLLRLNRHTKRVGKTCKIHLYICTSVQGTTRCSEFLSNELLLIVPGMGIKWARRPCRTVHFYKTLCVEESCDVVMQHTRQLTRHISLKQGQHFSYFICLMVYEPITLMNVMLLTFWFQAGLGLSVEVSLVHILHLE